MSHFTVRSIVQYVLYPCIPCCTYVLYLLCCTVQYRMIPKADHTWGKGGGEEVKMKHMWNLLYTAFHCILTAWYIWCKKGIHKKHDVFATYLLLHYSLSCMLRCCDCPLPCPLPRCMIPHLPYTTDWLYQSPSMLFAYRSTEYPILGIVLDACIVYTIYYTLHTYLNLDAFELLSTIMKESRLKTDS